MLKTLLKSVRQYKKESILAPIFVAIEVVFECLLPLIMASLIDQMTGEAFGPILRLAVILVVMALLSLLFGVLSGAMASTASCGFAKNLREDLFFKIQDFSFADIDYFSTSSLVTRMTTDVTNIQNAYQMIIRIVVRTPLMLIFSLVMCLTINVRMSFIFLALLPILGVVLFGISMHVHPIFKKIFKKYDALNNSVQENVAGIRVVKSFVREDYEKEKFDKAAREVCDDFTRVEKILALNRPFMMFCIYAAFMLISFFGANIIINTAGSSLTTGQLSSLISYGIQILSSMMMLSMVFVMVSMAMESGNRVAEVLTWGSSLESPENGLTEVPDGSIDFDHVSFRYQKDSKKAALSDISLNIKSGQTIGIMGGTGSSKTTLIQLISRLYDVSEGSVKVGGHDVREYDLETLRDAVSVVLQKNVLFSGTIKENLRWGNKEATDEELVEACRAAQAEEFIEQLPDRYDTRIERGGTNVSGGQKQRLCIARALLKKPKILILDDSTSAVDTKTDALIRRAFQNEIPDTTKIIIAQRVSSVQDADMILVLDDGKIAEQGTHEELLALNGIYKEAYETQTKSKEAV
ncbi:MAG: ABC transporter ATP-binding protein/permease [Lachnospiraceae bacterium]|nr:ABC transporter ATP-binding protein/permease [Lachnospiraceae bacterium]